MLQLGDLIPAQGDPGDRGRRCTAIRRGCRYASHSQRVRTKADVLTVGVARAEISGENLDLRPRTVGISLVHVDRSRSEPHLRAVPSPGGQRIPVQGDGVTKRVAWLGRRRPLAWLWPANPPWRRGPRGGAKTRRRLDAMDEPLTQHRVSLSWICPLPSRSATDQVYWLSRRRAGPGVYSGGWNGPGGEARVQSSGMASALLVVQVTASTACRNVPQAPGRDIAGQRERAVPCRRDDSSAAGVARGPARALDTALPGWRTSLRACAPPRATSTLSRGPGKSQLHGTRAGAGQDRTGAVQSKT